MKQQIEFIPIKTSKKVQEFIDTLNALDEFRNILFTEGERAANSFIDAFKQKNNL